MKNKATKQIVCHNCKQTITVKRNCYNHNDYISVATENGKVTIGDACCWNKMVNDKIAFTSQGWTLVEGVQC